MTLFVWGLATGFTIMLVGIIGGAWLMALDYAKASRRRAVGTDMCPCGHHLVYHEPNASRPYSGRCRASQWGGGCDCRQYQGPKAIK